jgi:hypothetical protein
MPADKQQEGSSPDRRKERINLNDYDGVIEDKEALKAHAADTPEGLSRALNEQFGGTSNIVRPEPNNF